MLTPKENMAANMLVREGAKPQTAADDTFITTQIYDRLAATKQCPQSMMLIAVAAFTSGSGAAGGKNTLTLALYHDTASGMGTEAVLDSDTYVYTWADNGANSGVHVLPVDLSSANRYVRGKAKLTEAGTITISNQTIGLIAVFGGMAYQPSSGYAAAGYEETTEPT